MFPACDGNIKLQLQRSTYVAYARRHAKKLQLNLDSSSLHGWDENSVPWMDEYFPYDVHVVLIAVNENEGVE